MKTVEMKIHPQKSDIHSLESFSTLEDSKEQALSKDTSIFVEHILFNQ